MKLLKILTEDKLTEVKSNRLRRGARLSMLMEEDAPKAIIMAGAAGSGKSYLLHQLGLQGLPHFNPDRYVEDPDSEMYNNLSAASQRTESDVKQAIGDKQSFVWDTTAGNYSKVEAIKNSGYQVFMVMVYTHPIISFLSNYERDRKIPKEAVFTTWRNTYQLASKYHELLGKNFIMFHNDRGDKYSDEITRFNQSAKKGAEGIKSYLKDYIERNGGQASFKSSFSQPFELSKEAQRVWDTEMDDVPYNSADDSLVKQLQKYWITWYEKNGVGPGDDKMKKKIDSIYTARDKRDQTQDEVYDNIADMITSDKFSQNITHNSIKDINRQVQNFL